MQQSKRVAFIAGLCSLLGFMSGVAIAGGGGPAGGGSTEFTQLMNNAQLVKVSADQALTASTTVQKYMTQLRQYQIELMNTIGLDPAVLAANLRDAQRAYNILRNYQQNIDTLRGSLQSQYAAYDQRALEARLKNMSWADYVAQVRQDTDAGNAQAKARLANEKAILDQVAEDYDAVENTALQIDANVSQHQDLQTLNHSMNRVVSQNAKMIEILARANGSDKADQIAEDAKKRQAQATVTGYSLDQNKAIRARQLRAMDIPR